MTFKLRSEFIYKTKQECEGFFIRRKNWIKIINLEECQEMVQKFKIKLQIYYENHIKRIIMMGKE